MEVHDLFLYLALLFISARICSEIANRFNIPSVIGELAAGFILGPSLLNLVSPDQTLQLLAQIGIILLLFEVGMDTDIYRLAKAGSKPVVVALVGFFVPLILGFGVAYWGFDAPLLTSLFIGGTLTATSIGITVRVLTDLRRRSSDEAQIVIGAAVLDDILGVLALAFLYQFSVQGNISVISLLSVTLYIVLFMALAPLVGKCVATIIDRFDQKSTSPGLLLTMILSLIFLFSYLAHIVGAPEIMGGFAAGIALGHRFRVRISKDLRLPFTGMLNSLMREAPDLAHRTEEQMRPLIRTFTPLFFVMVGVSLNLREVEWGHATIWLAFTMLFIIAMAGKAVSGFCIKEPSAKQMAIGLSMIPRGEVGLIFAKLGFSNALLNKTWYAALLLVVALTTVLPPFLLRWYYRRYFPAVAEEKN